MIHNETTHGRPLIRLSVINPFLKELALRDIDPCQLLEEHGVPVTVPDHRVPIIPRLVSRQRKVMIRQSPAPSGDALE